MNTLYCNLGGSRSDTLHLDTIPTVGAANYQAHSIVDVRRILAVTGAQYVMFSLLSLPKKAVPVTDPRLDSYISRMLHPKPQRTRKPKPVAVVVDDFDPADFVEP